MRGSASKYPDKKMTQAQAETALVMYLTNVRPALRAGITVESICRSYAVPARVAEYRLTLAQNRWAAETTPTQEKAS
jgi:hypothetical protein